MMVNHCVHKQTEGTAGQWSPNKYTSKIQYARTAEIELYLMTQCLKHPTILPSHLQTAKTWSVITQLLSGVIIP